MKKIFFLFFLTISIIGNCQSVYFNGNSTIKVPTSSSLTSDITSKITIETWIAITDSNFNDGDRSIIQTGNQNRYALWINQNRKISFYCYPWSIQFQGKNKIPLNIWTHIAIVYDANNSLLSSYINGVLDTFSTNFNSQLGNTNQPDIISIGSYFYNGNYNNNLFKGYIDELRIWNIVRTQAEINTYKCSSININNYLKGYWKFSNNYNDTSIYSNNAIGSNILFISENYNCNNFPPPQPIFSSIYQIQYKSSDSLALGKDRSETMDQYVTIIGRVIAPSRVSPANNDFRTLLRGSTSWTTYIQDTNNNLLFNGIVVRQATRNSQTLLDLIDTGNVIKIKGTVKEFWGTNSNPSYSGWLTQIELDETQQIQILSTGGKRPSPKLINISELSLGNYPNGIINYSGEKYEGMYVEIKNVKVGAGLANRQPFSIVDNNGNVLYIRDFSNFFSKQPSGDTLIPGWQPAPINTLITSIKGVIINANNEGIFGTTLPYAIVPIYPNDIKYDSFVLINESIEINNYSLSQNYPNPFNPTTKINFQLKNSGNVKLKVYNSLGKEVQILINQKMNSGEYSVDFDGSNLSNGVYFYTLKVNEYLETKKMILIK